MLIPFIRAAAKPMTDLVDKATRSRMMSGIRSRNTRPELLLRKGLHRLGFRYSLHNKNLPGKPDIVLSKYRALIFVHGCFWHAHNCHLFKWPATRKEFWRNKIMGNRERDEKHLQQLEKDGWRVLIVWECALKGKQKRRLAEVINTAANWVRFDSQRAEVCGKIP